MQIESQAKDDRTRTKDAAAVEMECHHMVSPREHKAEEEENCIQ